MAQLERYKQKAKKLKKQHKYTQAEALDHVVREGGHSSWKDYQRKARTEDTLNIPTPQTSFSFSESGEIKLTEDEHDSLKKDQQAELSDGDKLQLVSNQTALAKHGIEYSLFEPTATGLKKSILDATQPVRTHFNLEGFHDFSNQDQGPAHKEIKDAKFVTINGINDTKVSLYRPNTKKGDPRMWFRKLGGFAITGDQVAIVIFNGTAHLINLTRTDLNKCIRNNDPIGQFLTQYDRIYNEVSEELLIKLRTLAKKSLEAVNFGDTTVGMTIEAALGIEANSSKLPDYKGIELKSGRKNKNRTNLFAQVPDWRLSQCKSSAQILDLYGYERGEDFKLYCTVSAQKVNSQGLTFKYSDQSDELCEIDSNGNHVATWTGDLLRSRLQEKHAETFWIQADSELINGKEYFHLKSVIHTRSPLLSQLMPLIQSGVITMDHLIKRKGGPKPRVSEKGPLFKMDKRKLSLLFPEPIKYDIAPSDNNH